MTPTKPETYSTAHPYATTPKETPMNDQTTPDVTDDDRRLARDWAEHIVNGFDPALPMETAAARVILHAVPTPSRPTLADMTMEERYACRWMQCDVRNAKITHGVLANNHGGNTHVLDAEGEVWYLPPTDVTPRPDLPRMEWPGDTPHRGPKVTFSMPAPTAPAKVGDVIESADDPRIDALPVGSVLSDCDGETIAKRTEAWAGIGYIPIASERDEFGPWTVRRIGWEADQ